MLLHLSIPRHFEEMSPLRPFNPFLGLNPKYCLATEEILLMQERAISFTGDDFSIKTVNGIDVCKCKGKLMSLHQRKGIYPFQFMQDLYKVWNTEMETGIITVFTDVQGNELFALKHRFWSWSWLKRFKAVGPDGEDLFRVKAHFSCNLVSLLLEWCWCLWSLGFTLNYTVKFVNAVDGRRVKLEVKGEWVNRSAVVTCEGQPVASISRNFFNVRQIFTNRQTYFVKVAPGVDVTLIAALCVCLDEGREWEATRGNDR